MGDTKQGRDKQSRDADDRQRERELEEARERANEPEPPREVSETTGEVLREEGSSDAPRTCHRRGCDEPATFVVVERYLEETGHGPVTAEAVLCREHTAEESPTNLDHAYPEYVFRVVPLPEAEFPSTETT
jgi:hypothetical protein